MTRRNPKIGQSPVVLYYPTMAAPTKTVVLRGPDYGHTEGIDKRQVIQLSAADEQIVYSRGPKSFHVRANVSNLNRTQRDEFEDFWDNYTDGAKNTFEVVIPDYSTATDDGTLTRSTHYTGCEFEAGELDIPSRTTGSFRCRSTSARAIRRSSNGDREGELLVLARIQFPSLGPTAEVIVTDRRDVAAMFPGAELRVLDWGAISTLVDGGQDGVDITLSNAPDAAGDRFSEYWDSTNPPEGARVTFEASKVDATTPVWFTFFVGAVIQVSRVTEQQVVLRIADIGTKFERKIGDQITTTEFPQAPEEVLGSIKPIVLNEVQEYKPPLVREAKTCVLVDSILATETASVAVPLQKAVNTTKGWPKVGQARIDDEILSYDNTTETTGKKFLFTSRGAVAVHSPGDPIVELAKLKWCIAGHAVNPAKTIVYAISSKGTLAKLTETTDYTLTTGATGSFVELVSDSGLKVKFPSDEATIRRVEMDEAVNNGFTIGQVNPTAYNQAEYNTIANAGRRVEPSQERSDGVWRCERVGAEHLRSHGQDRA
jgi:hypothetical protein